MDLEEEATGYADEARSFVERLSPKEDGYAECHVALRMGQANMKMQQANLHATQEMIELLKGVLTLLEEQK